MFEIFDFFFLEKVVICYRYSKVGKGGIYSTNRTIWLCYINRHMFVMYLAIDIYQVCVSGRGSSKFREINSNF